jgi:hypothetical protein
MHSCEGQFTHDASEIWPDKWDGLWWEWLYKKGTTMVG